ncbi:MAG: helix-turn-helix transcriptional regulator [Clostridium sp.]|uniref:helix-turn-helix transcriptional regulator n=1 Tax=Clostridium sp. TaxID=1506 RepID=UPI003F3BCB5D
MGRLNNALTMLLLLRSRQKMSRKELAEALEVDIRQISRYKDDLCAAGIWIEEERGRYGGYSLKGPTIWFDVELNEDEIKALELAIKCTNIGTFPLKTDFYTAIIKILSKYNFDNYWHKNTAAQHRRISKYSNELKDKWIDINECIIKKRKIKIDYSNISGEKMIRKVHPYAIYVYEDANYMVAYCEHKKSIRNFKLVRISKIIKCEETFEKDGFDMKLYLRNRLGIYSDDREYEVKLKVYYPYAKCFKEHKWVYKEEIIDKCEEGYIIYIGHIQGKNDIVKWIMEMGSSAEVIGPSEIKEAVTNELNKTIDYYN